MSTPPPRYAPKRPFPSHAFVPGRTPRHATDARDGCDGRELGNALAPERWREDGDYLFGVDLYNAGFLWEAHEAWEGPWRASTDPRQRLQLQGLIQLAAACLKLEMAEPSGADRLARAASEKLLSLGATEFMGLAPAEVAVALDSFFAGRPASASGRPLLSLRTTAQPPDRPLA
ncbi:MAG: DUF309 domain-containing protein [Planctomycetes bacterium]|nr:DUF309 domain-containing protein [Planctomycetota bacterium]